MPETTAREIPLDYGDAAAEYAAVREGVGVIDRGDCGLVEATGRRGNMPPLHVHHRDDETFYVLEGRLTLFAAGAEPLELTAGEAGFARRGIPHTYRVESDDVRYLVIGSPAGFESFAREAGEPAEADEPPPPERPLDPVALAECAERYGIDLWPTGSMYGSNTTFGDQKCWPTPVTELF